MKKARNTKLIVIVIFIAFILIIFTHLNELEAIVHTLQKGNWVWLFVALIFQFLYYYTFTALYKSCFTLVRVKSAIRDLLPITFASVFVNLFPTIGTGVAALFVEDLVQREQSGTRATIGAILVQLIDFSVFLIILLFGVCYLLVSHSLKTYQGIASVIMVLMVGVLATILISSIWQISLIRKLLNFLRKIVNFLSWKTKHERILDKNWVEKRVIDFRVATRAIIADPKQMLKSLFIALTTHIFNMLSILCLFLAFHNSLPIGVLITGYAMTFLFTTITVTPQGIGIVESVMTLMFVSLGVPSATAAVTTLSYRGINLWLPLFIGLILFRRRKVFQTARG